jgi:hypothetical protein
MKLSQFKTLIREEVKKMLSEGNDIQKLPQIMTKLDANAASVGMKLSKKAGKSGEEGVNYIRKWKGSDGHVVLYTEDMDGSCSIYFETGDMSGNDDYGDWMDLSTWKDYFGK